MNNDRSASADDPLSADQFATGRRRLLRAAATAAPLVATLPSGAAYALASTAQCIVAGRSATQSTPPATPTVKPALTGGLTDKYARTAGFLYTFRKGTRPVASIVEVASIGASSGAPYYFIQSGTVTNNVTPYPYAPGQPFDPITFAGGSWTLNSGPTSAQLMILYRASSDSGDAYSNPTCATSCTPGAFDPSARCIFPLSQAGTPDQPGMNPGNNLGLTVSCLSSVHPAFSGRSCPS